MKKKQIQEQEKEKITFKDILNWAIPLITAIVYACIKLI
jgi:hypothetical protein